MKTLLKAGLSLLILYIVIRAINPKTLWELLHHTHPGYLLWSMAWFILSKFVAAFRYNDLLQTCGIQLNAGQQLRLYWLGMYYNLLLPGGISGDGYKIKKLMDHFQRPFRLLFSITLYDRISGMLALGQICLILAVFLPELQPFGWLWCLVLACSIPVSYLLFKRMIGAGARIWIRTSLQSQGVQLTQLISVLGLVFALQQPANWIGYSVVFMISSVVAMLPLTIGGAGARELTFLWGAQVLHLDSERSVAIAFLFYLISTVVSLYGLLYSFRSDILKKSAS